MKSYLIVVLTILRFYQEETLEIEYFEATVPPQRAATLPHDDWVSNIDCSLLEWVLSNRSEGFRVLMFLFLSQPLCHCIIRRLRARLLIITGTARGQIWYQDDSRLAPVLLIKETLYHPTFDHYRAANDSPDAQRVTFTQWYEVWLDQQIRMAQERWRARGEDVPPLTLAAE